MIRKTLLTGFALLLGASAGAEALDVAIGSDPLATVSPQALAKGLALTPAPSSTVLYYAPDVTGSDVAENGRRDAEKLGFPLLRTMAAARAVVVRGTEADVRRALAAAEGSRFTHAAAAGQLRNSPHHGSLVALTSRLAVQFTPQATEAQKAAFLKAHSLTRERELTNGVLHVRSSEEPGLRMIGVAERMLASSPLLANVRFEYAFFGEPTLASNSIEVTDPLFPLQWPLYNDGQNTNFDLGRVDEDPDFPRAWMYNVIAGKTATGENPTAFGDSSIVLSIFDSGTERNHVDLAESIDPRVGFDAVDGNFPDPSPNILGAHGTAMAGLISAQLNGVGLVGAAPGVQLYTSRVFSSDYSTTNLRVGQALTDSVDKKIDVNVHPYVMAVDAESAPDVEAELRASFESGRNGIGTPNVAAAGNFFSQVEYPASSQYCYAVGSVTAEGTRAYQSNWGGNGIDFVMPGFLVKEDSSQIPTLPATGSEAAQYIATGTGVITTDLTGNPGVAERDSGEPTNLNGEYAVAGRIVDYTSTAAGISYRIGGNSVSAALGGALVGLMLSDERYVNLPPHDFLDVNLTSRQERRNRAASGSATLLRAIYDHAEFPEGRALAFVDQYEDFLGHGRPNAANVIVREANTAGSVDSQPSDDFGYTAQIDSSNPVYSVTFDQIGTVVDQIVRFDELAQGWGPVGGITPPAVGFTGPTDDGRIFDGGLLVSPHLEAIPRYYFEDGSVDPDPPSSGGLQNFFFAWTDSRPDNSQPASAITFDRVNYLWNPDGTYHAAQTRFVRSDGVQVISRFAHPVVVQSPLIDIPLGVPLVLTLQIAHELSVQDADRAIALISDPLSGLSEAEPEVDLLNVIVVSSTDSERVVARITGDSTSRRKQRLLLSDGWPSGQTTFYDPKVGESEMIQRTYRFYVPPQNDPTVRIRLALRPSDSFLPVYRPEQTSPVTYTLLPNVTRDARGFILRSASLEAYSAPYADYLAQTDFQLDGDGLFPTWSTSAKEVFFSREITTESNASHLLQVDAFPVRLKDPSDLTSTEPKVAKRLVKTNERITGLKAHPSLDLLAMTTNSPEGDALYSITGDGIRQTLITRVEDVRDPSWAINGSQIVFASPTSVQIGSFQEDGSLVLETVISTASQSFLTDFHSPVFDPAAGFVIFTARRAGVEGAALQVHVATRSGRLITFSNDIRAPFLNGWTGVDISDVDISQSGKRLIFAANASSAPLISSSGEVVSPAQESAGSFLYAVENFHRVVSANEAPAYTKITLTGEAASSARYPRIRPDAAGNEIVWVAYDQPLGSGTSPVEGRIMRQKIADETTLPRLEPTPIASPTVTPSATATPVNVAQVALAGQYFFTLNAEGWEFRNAAPTFSPPVDGIDLAKGALTLGSVDQNTFGYWESPLPAIQARRDTLYLVRALLTSQASAATQMPRARVRVNSRNYESAFTSETESVGDANLGLDPIAPRAVDLLFRPPAELFDLSTINQTYTIAVDLINVADDPAGVLEINAIDLYRLDDVPAVSGSTTTASVITATRLIDTQNPVRAGRWTNGGAPGMTLPQFIPATGDTQNGFLAASVLDGANTFGYWSIPATSPLVASSVTRAAAGGATDERMPFIFRATFRVGNRFEANALSLPDVRLRLSPSSFERTVTASLISNDTGATVPFPGEPRDVQVFLVLPRLPNNSNAFSAIAAMDLLSFYPGRSITAQPIEFESFRLEQVFIPDYPLYPEGVTAD